MKIPSFPLEKIKQKQVTLLWVTVALLTVSIGTILIVFAQDSLSLAPAPTGYKSEITTGSDRLKSQEVWMEQMKSENELQKKRMEAMEKMVETLVKFKDPSPMNTPVVMDQNQPVGSLPLPPNAQGSIDDIQKDVRQQMNVDPQSVAPVAVNNVMTLPQTPGEMPLVKNPIDQAVKEVTKFRSKGIQRLSINLPRSRADKPLRTVDNYIPSGAFAPAVVLTGVDASTSVQAAGNPRPALLQIMGEAILPGGHKANLKGCHVTTAVTGDISSERAEIRIERLSCVEQKTGEVIELGVKGYLAGSDSKAGQRGRLVDRTGPMMRNAAVGGFLSGLAGFFSQNQNPVTFFPSGIAESNKMSANELLGQGISKGAGNALEKYADFYIKRAEQMQPVIEVTAGQKVAVVFTEGFSLTDSVTRQAVSKVNDQERYQQIQAIESEGSKPVDAWLPKGETNND
jgi:conjugal transfer pilus assembly protein TraB